MNARVRDLILVSFLALSVGFGAGWWMGSQQAEPSATPGESARAPHPVGAQEYLQLGMQALGAGDFQTAERRFRRAAELQPETAAPHADLAVALMYQERWEEAHAELETARRYDPDMPEIYFLEGILYRDGMADTASALESWERFLAMVPEESPQAATVRGWIAEFREGSTPDTVPRPSSEESGSVAAPSGDR